MEPPRLGVKTGILLLGSALVVVALVFVLQLPSLSIRTLIVGERIVGGGQFWLLELIAGALTSVVVTTVAVLLFRRFVLWVGAISVAIQLGWMAFTQTFHVPADSVAEIAFRSAEGIGIIVGAAIAVLVVRGLSSGREKAANP